LPAAQRLPLLELERAVVECRRQAEAVFDQRLLARAVAAVHGADLRNAGVGLVDKNQRVLRQVFEQSVGGGSPGGTAGQVARVVFDALAVAQLADHLDVVARALLQALRLEKLVSAPLSCFTRSSSSTSIKSMAPSIDIRDARSGSSGKDRHPRHLRGDTAPVKRVERLMFSISSSNSSTRTASASASAGKDIDHITAHAVGAAAKSISLRWYCSSASCRSTCAGRSSRRGTGA
jgi:hypothetical protein